MNIKKAWRRWRLKRNTKKAIALLLRIDRSLADRPRWQRRQFWRDFIRSPKTREIMYKNIRVGK